MTDARTQAAYQRRLEDLLSEILEKIEDEEPPTVAAEEIVDDRLRRLQSISTDIRATLEDSRYIWDREYDSRRFYHVGR